MLLKYLGERGADCPVRAAVAVSVPFRLDQCADRIGLGFSRVYQAHFMKAMIAYVRDKQRLFRERGLDQHLATLGALGTLDGMRTFWDFDGRITAPLHGFSDASDYYRRASSRYYLGGIAVPTLLIQTEDDPFVFRHSIPEVAELSPCTQLELHRHGGHVASSKARHCGRATTWNGASPAARRAPAQRRSASAEHRLQRHVEAREQGVDLAPRRLRDERGFQGQ